MRQSKVLVLDIETAPIIAYVWGTREQNIGVGQIKNDWYIISWAAKWLGEPSSKIVYRDQRDAVDLENDKILITGLWKLLDEADIVVTQNGKRFDSPKLNARFIAHSMPPPSPYKHLDTYQIAKQVAGFTFNSLEYLSDKLCTKYKKLKHNKFPGFELWKECLKGNDDAWNEMQKYNIHDVLATEELYNKLKAWTPQHMPSASFIATDCRVCGSGTKMWQKGYEIKKSGRYHRYQCQACFAWTTGKKAKETE